MKIVTISIAVRSDEDAAQLAEEAFKDLRDMYGEAGDDVELLGTEIRDPTENDLDLLAERRGED